MSKQSVFCITTARHQAEKIVAQLKSAIFSQGDISALLTCRDSDCDFAPEENRKVAESAGVGTDGLIEAAPGWIAGVGAMAIPGVGPFIAAGPIIAGLRGAAIGPTAGGLTRGLIDMGVPELKAKRYEGRLKAGNILISVHTENSNELACAKGILKDAGAEDFCLVADSATPIPWEGGKNGECLTPDNAHSIENTAYRDVIATG